MVDLSKQFEKDKEEHGINSGGDFFEIAEGENKMRIMCEPKIVVERFKKGICYKGAPYCQTENIEAEWEEMKQAAIKAGKDPKKVAKPSLTYRYLCWIISRKDNKVYLYKMPLTVFKALVKLQQTEDFEFDDFPMPYDITVNAEKAGSKEVSYQITPRAKHTELTEAEVAAFTKQTSVDQIIDRMKEKARDQHEGGSSPDGAPEYDDEDIPM